MASKVNRAILELAADNLEVQFILKTKIGYGKQQLESLFSSFASEDLPVNVDVKIGGTGHELLRGASVVVGFNSTAVLEAVAAGVPTVVPHIFSTKERKHAGGAHLVQEAVEIADTVVLLKQKILSALNADLTVMDLSPGQSAVLEKYLGNSDGRAGQRLRTFLNQAVEGSFRPSND